MLLWYYWLQREIYLKDQKFYYFNFTNRRVFYSVHTLLKANTNIFVHIFDEKIIPPDNILDMLSQATFYAAEF